MEMTKPRDILYTLAAGDMVSLMAGHQQPQNSTQDVSINIVYIMINIS